MASKKVAQPLLNPPGLHPAPKISTSAWQRPAPKAIVKPPKRPADPCFCCHSPNWWLLPDGCVWRCMECHPPVGTKRQRVVSPHVAQAIGTRRGEVAAPTSAPTAALVADHAIYVDEIVRWPQTPAPGAERFFGNGKPSCHMSTPDHSPAGLERLHRLAEQIGMKRSWFQNSEVMPHYDLTPPKRVLAIKAGAVSVECTEIVRLCGREHVRKALTGDAA